MWLIPLRYKQIKYDTYVKLLQIVAIKQSFTQITFEINQSVVSISYLAFIITAFFFYSPCSFSSISPVKNKFVFASRKADVETLNWFPGLVIFYRRRDLQCYK